ncbi:type II secretion system protein GspD [Roseomonas sp. GCM10028921]
MAPPSARPDSAVGSSAQAARPMTMRVSAVRPNSARPRAGAAARSPPPLAKGPGPGRDPARSASVPAGSARRTRAARRGPGRVGCRADHTSGVDSPTIQQRRLRTVASVASGQTIALGGLIREADGGTRSGLPFLVHIPVLRELTGVRSRSRRRTELLVLLTPRVVQSTEDLRRGTEELRSWMTTMAPRVELPPQRVNAAPVR